MAQRFASTVADLATYEEVKNLAKRPEVLLIDVREPNELAETGVVPTAINIPCKFYYLYLINHVA